MTFEAEVTIAALAAVASVGSTLITWAITKNREINVERMRNKMERYDDLTKSLTALVESHGNSSQSFIDAYYRAGMYASREVLNACSTLLYETKGTPQFEIGPHELQIDEIYNAIRRDTMGQKQPPYPFRAYHYGPGGIIP